MTYKNFVDFKSIHKYYEKHNVFVFPSICENTNILIEAMASGLPILSSKNEPMPEFLGKMLYSLIQMMFNQVKNLIFIK